jgi:hypothetical protein
MLKKAKHSVDLNIEIEKVEYLMQIQPFAEVINIIFDANLFTNVITELVKNVNKRLNILLHTI